MTYKSFIINCKNDCSSRWSINLKWKILKIFYHINQKKFFATYVKHMVIIQDVKCVNKFFFVANKKHINVGRNTNKIFKEIFYINGEYHQSYQKKNFK